MTAREFLFNGDFDATLRGAASALEEKDFTYVHEMAVHFLFAGDAQDSLIVHRPLLQDFLAYLRRKRMDPPQPILHPSFTSEAAFTPFGWNDYAARCNERYHHPSAHPPLDAVRRANSRAFSHALEARIEGEAEGGIFHSYPALEDSLRARPNAGGWVVKGNHGHAGTANVRLFGPLPGEDERKLIESLFKAGGCVALEPWHDRVLDMAINFRVDRLGAIHDLRGHELINSRDGAFLGVRLAPDRQAPEPWRASLADRAGIVGEALRDLGYFGPVGMDAYTWRDPAAPDASPRLRAMADINARYSMALPAHGLGRRLPGKWLLWEWYKPKKLDLPSSYEELSERLGPSDFDPATGEGILATSPFWVTHMLPTAGEVAEARGDAARAHEEISGAQGGAAPGRGDLTAVGGSPAAGRLRPRRVGFLFSASTAEALEALRRDFPLRRKTP